MVVKLENFSLDSYPEDFMFESTGEKNLTEYLSLSYIATHLYKSPNQKCFLHQMPENMQSALHMKKHFISSLP